MAHGDRAPLGVAERSGYPAARMKGPVIKLDDVTWRVGDCVAVRGATVELSPGVIHAIVGENGAGKSTLMKLAAGVLAPTSGRVLVDRSPLAPATPAEAIRRGIGMVHQHFMLVEALSALDNLMLGSEPVRSLGRLNEARAKDRAQSLMAEIGLEVPLDEIAGKLSVGERQRLEIVRVLYRGARALLLDEPTAVLSPLEAEELYAMLRKLAEGGSTVAVVTHRLDEVTRFADRVTVMRRGSVVLSRPWARGTSDEAGEITRAIMDGEPPPRFSPPALGEEAKALLEVSGLEFVDADGRRRLDGIDLSVRAGEIVGVAGVEGNGQRELVRTLGGLEPKARGRVLVAGRDISREGVRARRSMLGVVYEDRHREGLVLDAPVGDNLILGDLGDGAADFDEAAVIARRLERFRVEPPDARKPAGELSGGNQQKIVIARALDRPVVAAVLAQPTRGVDIGAAAAIHAAIGEAAARGVAVLVVSADLHELRTLSHRIVVMRRGKLVASFTPDASEMEIGRAMLGAERAPT